MINNPHESLTTAYAHALFTGQLEFCSMVEAHQAEFNDLCNSLVAEGMLPARGDDGYAGARFQALIIEGCATGDERFERLAELTKMRLMVNVTPEATVTLN